VAWPRFTVFSRIGVAVQELVGALLLFGPQMTLFRAPFFGIAEVELDAHTSWML